MFRADKGIGSGVDGHIQCLVPFPGPERLVRAPNYLKHRKCALRAVLGREVSAGRPHVSGCRVFWSAFLPGRSIIPIWVPALTIVQPQPLDPVRGFKM